jgi:hypothetical protein
MTLTPGLVGPPPIRTTRSPPDGAASAAIQTASGLPVERLAFSQFPRRLVVDVKAILTPPCIFCIENHL